METADLVLPIIFAMEVTGAHFGVAPLLLGNSAAFLFSIFFLKEEFDVISCEILNAARLKLLLGAAKVITKS